MKEKYYIIAGQAKEEIIVQIERFLVKLPGLSFAYVHGSFVREDKFRDIDIAIYLKSNSSAALQAELELETELYNIVQYPVDVRMLNNAPLSFRYNVIKYGKHLAVINDDARSDFEENVLSQYFDFAPYRQLYLKEALGRGV
jgi:predicted nucleotidyltransferase